MKPTEIKTLKKLVKIGKQQKLSAADLALLLRSRFAVQEYEAAVSPPTPLQQNSVGVKFLRCGHNRATFDA